MTGVTAIWDDLIRAARSAGKTLLATALEHASPAAVTAHGALTIELDEANGFYAQSIESGRAELLALVQSQLPAISRLDLRGGMAMPSAQLRRISNDDIRSERLATLRRNDPVLGAAIDALDLDVVD